MRQVRFVRWCAMTLALVCLALGTGGCRAPVPAITPASQSLSKLVWFVDPTAVANETGPLQDGPSLRAIRKLGLASMMPQAFARALLKAGYGVVEDRGASHDVTARITITTEYVYGGGTQLAETTASVRVFALDATLLDDVTVTVTPKIFGSVVYVADYPDILAAEAVNKFGSSGRVAAFAAAPDRTRAVATSGSSGSSQPQLATTAPHPSAPGAFIQGAPQPTAYAIIIGIEKYAAKLPPPTGARADAQRFAEVARTSLGIPASHIQLALDEQATKGGILRALDWAKANVPDGGRVYFYFSGHGAPNAADGAAYLVPTDGDPQYLDATAVPMKDVLTKLGETKAREALAIVDSCFSGAGGRSVLPPGARPLMRVKDQSAPAQLALFSASGASEISGPDAGGSGGLFTRFVLEALGSGAADLNGDGQVSLDELAQWVTPRVAREAKKDNRDQNPGLLVGNGLGAATSFIVAWGFPAK